jgi:hypothetical protein
MKRLIFLIAASLFFILSPNSLQAQEQIMLASTTEAQFEADASNLLLYTCVHYPNTFPTWSMASETTMNGYCLTNDTYEVVYWAIYSYNPPWG